MKRYVEYDEILKEIYSENDEESHEDISKTKNKLLNRKRVSIRRKEENFSKLSQKEKVEKMTKLSKLVKRYRRKHQCLQTKIKNNIGKIFYKHLCEKLKINYKNKYLNHNLNLDLFQVIKALSKVHSYDGFEYVDQKYAIETLINLLAEGKLPLDSINFKKICTQLRLMLPKESIKYLNKKGSQITIQFPEREIKISKKEYEKYHNYINNNDVLRKIFGIEREERHIPQLNAAKKCMINNGMQFLPVLAVPMMSLPAEFGNTQRPFLLAVNNGNIVDESNLSKNSQGNYILLVPQQMESCLPESQVL